MMSNRETKWVRAERNESPAAKKSARILARTFAPLAAALLCLAAAGCGSDSKDLVVSGRVEVDTIRVGSKIGGRVEKVAFDEGDSAKGGEAIIELERTELDAQMAQAKASVAQAQAQLDLLLAGSRAEDIRRAEASAEARRAELQLRRKGFREEEVREAEAEFKSAKSRAELAQKEFERAESLFKDGTIDQSQLDIKRSAHETAQASLQVAGERVALVKSGSRPEEIAMAQAALAQAEADLERLRNGPRPEEIAAQRAALEAARANVARLESQLAETRILAPEDCVVETLDLHPGDLIRAGETAAVLNRKQSPWVRCYVPENRLGRVRPGMKVGVRVDSFPGQVFPGVVRRVQSEAEFTPRNVQTSEKRAELVFEMKVDIVERGGELRSGMFADVDIPSGAEKAAP